MSPQPRGAGIGRPARSGWGNPWVGKSQPGLVPDRYLVRGLNREALLTAAAVHEAGHIVSALALGLTVESSVVVSTLRGIGGVTYLSFGSIEDYGGSSEAAAQAFTSPEMMRKRTVQALAGSVAENCAKGIDQDVSTVAVHDLETANRLAFMTTRPRSDDGATRLAKQYIDECFSAARALVLESLPTVKAVAEHLRDRVNLVVDGDALKRLAQAP